MYINKVIIFAIIALMVLLLLISIGPGISLAQDNDKSAKVTIDLSKLSDQASKEVLGVIRRSAEEPTILPDIKRVTITDIEKWANIVTSIIKTMASDLNIEVNKFVETRVGMITAGIIVYKVVGKDIFIYAKRVVFTIIGYPIVMLLLVWSFSTFHMPKKVKVEKVDSEGTKTTRVEYIRRCKWNAPFNNYNPPAEAVSVAVHVILAIALTITAIACIVA